MADYKIVADGTGVVLLTQKALNRISGPKPPLGTTMAFETRRDTADFVRIGEAEGYTFEGKEFVAGA